MFILLSFFSLGACVPSSGKMAAKPKAARSPLRGAEGEGWSGTSPHVRGCCLCSSDRLGPIPALELPGEGSKELEDAAVPIWGAQGGW